MKIVFVIASAAGIALGTAGCSSPFFYGHAEEPSVGAVPALPPPSQVPPPADYRHTLRTTLPPDLKTGQVSEMRPTHGPQLGNWMVCVRVMKPVPVVAPRLPPGTPPAPPAAPTPPPMAPVDIAAFYEGDKLLTTRRAVQLDECETANYQPLGSPPPPPKAGKRKRSGH